MAKKNYFKNLAGIFGAYKTKVDEAKKIYDATTKEIRSRYRPGSERFKEETDKIQRAYDGAMQIAYGEYTKDVKAAIDLARFQIGESVAANVTEADKAIFERLADRNTAPAERAILAARVSPAYAAQKRLHEITGGEFGNYRYVGILMDELSRAENTFNRAAVSYRAEGDAYLSMVIAKGEYTAELDEKVSAFLTTYPAESAGAGTIHVDKIR